MAGRVVCRCTHWGAWAVLAAVECQRVFASFFWGGWPGRSGYVIFRIANRARRGERSPCMSGNDTVESDVPKVCNITISSMHRCRARHRYVGGCVGIAAMSAAPRWRFKGWGVCRIGHSGVLGGPGRPGNLLKKFGGWAPYFVKGFLGLWAAQSPSMTDFLLNH